MPCNNCRKCKDYQGEMLNQYDQLVAICHRFKHNIGPPLWMGCEDFEEIDQKCNDCSKWTIYGKICKGDCDK